MPLDQREAPADAVVHHHAGVAGDDAAAEVAADRLDQRDHHAVAVSRCQVGRVAVVERAVCHVGRRRVGVDEIVAPPGPRLRQQAVELHVVELRIGDVAQPVGEGELLRLDHQVDRLRVERVVDLGVLDDVELLEQDQALAWQACLVHRVAAIGDRQRRGNVGLVLGEVLGAQQAAPTLQVSDHPLRDVAAVKRRSAVAADRFQRVGEVGLHKPVAGFERFAIAEEQRGRRRVFPKHVGRVGDV